MQYALILAGGIGQRMGSDTPKQFLKIGDKSIISHTLDVFLKHKEIQKTIVLVPEDWIDYTKEIFERDFGSMPDIVIIPGGAARNDTIMNGIKYIKDNCEYDESTSVITHDAVRPFVTPKIIDDNIEAMKNHVACDTVIPATDTIVESLDNVYISNIPDRSKLYQGQTPQSFRIDVFEKLFDSLTDDEKNILTDAAKVFVIKGEKVALVDGSTENIKMTHPSDLNMAEAILGDKQDEK